MPILYAAVAHGAKVVAREGHHKDFDVIVDALLQQIPRGTEQKKSYVHQGCDSGPSCAPERLLVLV